MGDLKDPRLIYLKGFLFLLLGLMAAAGLIAQSPTLTTAVLLGLAIWSFCRLYYFMFYVIETYIPNLQAEKEREQAEKLAQQAQDQESAAAPEAPPQRPMFPAVKRSSHSGRETQSGSPPSGRAKGNAAAAHNATAARRSGRKAQRTRRRDRPPP